MEGNQTGQWALTPKHFSLIIWLLHCLQVISSFHNKLFKWTINSILVIETQSTQFKFIIPKLYCCNVSYCLEIPLQQQTSGQWKIFATLRAFNSIATTEQVKEKKIPKEYFGGGNVCIGIVPSAGVLSHTDSQLFSLPCLRKTSWPRGHIGVDLKKYISVLVFTSDHTFMIFFYCCVHVLGHWPNQSTLPAVSSAIGKGHTGSVVNTRRFVIHTLQSCKRRETC